jgi:hypothetical protein
MLIKMANYKIYLFVILLGVIVIGIVAVAARYLREINAAREALNNLGSQVIETACGPIEHARIGESAPVILICEGFTLRLACFARR